MIATRAASRIQRVGHASARFLLGLTMLGQEASSNATGLQRRFWETKSGLIDSAGIAAPAQDDVLNVTDRPTSLVGQADIHSGKADNVPAIVAEKMGMFGTVVIFGAEPLEAPDVVAQVHPCCESVFDQIVQVSVDRSPVKPERHEFLREVRMAYGRLCGLESAEDLQSRHCRPQASLAENLLQVGRLQCGIVAGLRHTGFLSGHGFSGNGPNAN